MACVSGVSQYALKMVSAAKIEGGGGCALTQLLPAVRRAAQLPIGSVDSQAIKVLQHHLRSLFHAWSSLLADMPVQARLAVDVMAPGAAGGVQQLPPSAALIQPRMHALLLEEKPLLLEPAAPDVDCNCHLFVLQPMLAAAAEAERSSISGRSLEANFVTDPWLRCTMQVRTHLVMWIYMK